ncbi:MAG TPA: glycosyltransferase family 4 protein [Candidatus Acidoferrales bacterium]|jgi:glycosyltransferase involved in cell wall biosynthesis
MNILIYSHAFAPQIGGVETYALLLARGLASRDAGKPAQITVVSQSPKKDFDDSAMPFAIVRQPGIIQLRKLIRESDVVHLAGPVIVPLTLALLARKPVVVEHHGYQASCPNGLLLYQPTKTACPNHYMRNEFSACLKCNTSESGWLSSVKMLLLTPLRRWLCRRVSVNLCITNHVAQRIELPRSQVVYYGIPESLTTEIESAPKQITPTSPLSIGFLGRLVEEKGVPTLIAAMHTLRDKKDRVRLIIIGDGPQRPILEAMAREQNGFQPGISFSGSLQGEKLFAALANVDVLVMPSVNEEPAGLVVMEQMIRGCPVIVSDHGGGPELAGDAGLKFPPGNAAVLAACIRQLADDPSLLRELGIRAKNRATAVFSLDRMIEEHDRIFQKLMSEPKR